MLFHLFHPVIHGCFPCFIGYLPQRHGFVKPQVTSCALLSHTSIVSSLALLLFFYQHKLFYQLPTDGAKMLMRDSGYLFFHDQDSPQLTRPRPGPHHTKPLFCRLLRTQKQVRARRVFSRRKLSDAQVRTVGFAFLEKTATNLRALFLDLSIESFLYLYFNLKMSNPFTFVGYHFIGSL